LLRLILFVLPLGLDTFAEAAALGVTRPPRRDRNRVSHVLAAFETAMPLVGLVLGRVLGGLVGSAADYVAIAMLATLGLWMVAEGSDGDEGERAARLVSGSGLALVAIGISISLDELAIGFAIGLLHLPIWLAVILIGLQAFVVAQLGLWLGARISERARDNAERLAGVALIGLAVLLGLEKLA